MLFEASIYCICKYKLVNLILTGRFPSFYSCLPISACVIPGRSKGGGKGGGGSVLSWIFILGEWRNVLESEKKSCI